MKKTFLSIAVLLGSLSLFAQTNQEIINKGKELTIKNGCTACHTNSGSIAPDFTVITVKYKKLKELNARFEISNVIKKGSKYLGKAPIMPAYTQISESEIRAISTYILSLSK